MRYPLLLLASALIGACGVSPCLAQTRLTSIEELRRQLSVGDSIVVVPTGAQPIIGRLVRLDRDNLEIQPAKKRSVQDTRPRDVRIAFDAIQSLERPRDPVRNGTLLGAAAGAGVGGAMFLAALATDRNEIDEWAGPYAAGTAICAGVGALIGWAIDAASSRPHIKFDASGGKTIVSVRPLYSRRYGIAIAVSMSR